MPYLVADGFLRRGADQLVEGKTRPDGLLFVFGPDTGLPPVISDTGTVATIAAITGGEALVDARELGTVAALTAADALAETGLVTPAVLLIGTEALADGSVVVTICVPTVQGTLTALAGLITVSDEPRALLALNELRPALSVDRSGETLIRAGDRARDVITAAPGAVFKLAGRPLTTLALTDEPRARIDTDAAGLRASDGPRTVIDLSAS